MASVMIIDDIDVMRRGLNDALTKEGHKVFFAKGKTVKEMVDNAVSFADSDPGYFLILDFNLTQGPFGEAWGGIWFYIALRDRGALPESGRVLVASRYIPENVRALRSASKPTDAFIARVFVELEEIEDDNIFKLDVNEGHRRVAERVTAIQRQHPRTGGPVT